MQKEEQAFVFAALSLLHFVCACPSRCYGGEERHSARDESVELK